MKNIRRILMSIGVLVEKDAFIEKLLKQMNSYGMLWLIRIEKG